MNNILNIEVTSPNTNYNKPFKKEILENIINEKVIATWNTSFKANQLRRYWRISGKRKLMKYLIQ